MFLLDFPLFSKKEVTFFVLLKRNRMCVSMELVTAVLGDHGQRPRDDYGEWIRDTLIGSLI